MTLSRWSPFLEMQTEMNRLQNDMHRLFGRFDGTSRQIPDRSEYPPVNAWEDDARVFVEAELPGMNLADLELFVSSGNQLTISGERKEPAGHGTAWHRRERGYGKFTRVIELPGIVDDEKVVAHFKLGVLTITLPKREEAKPRRIAVKAE